jgi:hypothetical protein
VTEHRRDLLHGRAVREGERRRRIAEIVRREVRVETRISNGRREDALAVGVRAESCAGRSGEYVGGRVGRRENAATCSARRSRRNGGSVRTRDPESVFGGPSTSLPPTSESVFEIDRSTAQKARRSVAFVGRSGTDV